MFSFPGRLYPITDTHLSGLSHAEQVSRLSTGGAKLIQIREKQLASNEFFEQAKSAVTRARSMGAMVIINDRVDIAMAIGADGVHLGQEDLPPAEARQLMGPDAIIGYSTHNARQVQAAAHLPVSYIAIGPIFATTTKANPDLVLGLDGFRQIRRLVNGFPVVAIGGITAENAGGVIEAGADAVAVISGLVAVADLISERTRQFLGLLQ
ncbi:MAG TPA: thiamine phosphate synthase [Pyrinomonadaceae bacterium]|jgi:thiamine-phosphate pyrophosphorylase|nr:thiamine phosphate synthase [Pyrinomonadaceae bacterium]